ncbi:MAG: NAD(P)-dependent oxidoreductase, partial [Blastocatellia bacterium]
KNIATICFPFSVIMLLSWALEKYHLKTHGQIPAVLTPYESSAMWKGHQFENKSIKKLGWKQIIPTAEAMSETFAYLRADSNGHHQ